ncbi:MAG TPA: hypothetical protein VIK27_07625 [Candidatus Aquilonibacter sp.]
MAPRTVDPSLREALLDRITAYIVDHGLSELSLRDRKHYAEFFDGAVEEWPRFLADPLIASGATKAQARTAASVILAGYRELLLDFAATGDRARVEAALQMWLPTLDSLVTENETT